MSAITKSFERFFESTLANYYGVTGQGQVCALACVSCSKIMHDVQKFMKTGPALGNHAWFCKEHALSFNKQVTLLEENAQKEGKNFTKIYKEVTAPFKTVEEQLLKEWQQKHPSSPPAWTFLG